MPVSSMSMKEDFREFFSDLPEDWKRERFVPAVGPEDAEVMMIGEAPGENEVEQNEPFVGRAGKRLDETLKEIGVDRSEIYITNLVKVRPPENRDPKKEEIERWKPLLEKEVEKVDPEKIVTLGNFASRQMLDTSDGISSIHGEVFSRRGYKIVPVFHPAATLYDPSNRPKLREDLKKAFGKSESPQRKLSDL